MAPKAIITGVSGQDGSYLAELLVSKGYEVHGLVLRSELEESAQRLGRLSAVVDKITLHPASIETYPSIYRIVERVKPDECYHLAAQSFSQATFDEEFLTFNSNINGTHYMLSALKEAAPQCRFFFAASSEVFGRADSSPQQEQTPFHPRSVYGISKATGYYLTSYYRDTYHMYASSAILYNHESPRRGVQFVTRKITNGAVRIKRGQASELRMGNLDSVRDWGFAGDYVEAMWRMLQQPQAEDFVIATGETHSVREFCEVAFNRLGLDYRDYVVVDERFYRPVEAVTLVGDAAKARRVLDWQPKVSFQQLVEMMVEDDLKSASN